MPGLLELLKQKTKQIVCVHHIQTSHVPTTCVLHSLKCSCCVWGSDGLGIEPASMLLAAWLGCQASPESQGRCRRVFAWCVGSHAAILCKRLPRWRSKF